jgi:hypothetical protein
MSVNTPNNQEFQLDPLLVPVHPNGVALTQQERVDMWLYLSQIPEEAFLLLSSPLLTEAMQRMQKTLQLNGDVSMRIASLLRWMYFGRITFEQVPPSLKSDVGVPQDKIISVVNFIRTEILPLKAQKQETVAESVPRTDTRSLMLLDALAKFPRINEQQITSERIKIRSEKDSVRGSVQNWMRAYRDIVGARQHTAVERGQFLFQGDNTKKLPPAEREKVALLLKALDENEAIAIDPKKQIIVFPVETAVQDTAPAPIVAPPIQSPASTFSFAQAPRLTPSFAAPVHTELPTSSDSADPFHFSSGHILPSEKQEAVNQASQTNVSPRPASFGLGFNVNPYLTPQEQRPPVVIPPPIPPASQRKEVWQTPGAASNVVDLRSDE